MSHYRDSKDFVPDMSNLPTPELLDKGLPSRPGPPRNEAGESLIPGHDLVKTAEHTLDRMNGEKDRLCPIGLHRNCLCNLRGRCRARLPEGCTGFGDCSCDDCFPPEPLVSELQHYSSGMIREPLDGKTNWALVYDGPMLERWAEHLTRGAKEPPEGKGKRNWMKADSEEDLERFRESAARHFAQWISGETDEDHAAAVLFNVNGYEHVRKKLGL